METYELGRQKRIKLNIRLQNKEADIYELAIRHEIIITQSRTFHFQPEWL
jgi:hypothetical protein